MFKESRRPTLVELGAAHPQVAASRLNLAIVNSLQGRYDKARALFEKTLQVCHRHFRTELNRDV